MIAKLLGLQLRLLVFTLVNEQQMGFILKHQILENISITLLSLACIQRNCVEALFLKLDFEKAFDKVDFNYIWANL